MALERLDGSFHQGDTLIVARGKCSATFSEGKRKIYIQPLRMGQFLGDTAYASPYKQLSCFLSVDHVPKTELVSFVFIGENK